MKRISWILMLVLALAMPATALAADENPEETAVKAWVSKMVTKYRKMGYLGIETKMVEKEGGYKYIKVRDVAADSPAYHAGFQPGDVLMAVNGAKIEQGNEWAALKKAKSKMAVGSDVTFVVSRKNGDEWTKKELAVTLGQVPSEVLARWIGNSVLKRFEKDAGYEKAEYKKKVKKN